MNDITPRHDDHALEAIVNRTEFRSAESDESPSILRCCIDFIRQNIGLKPLHLLERYADAEVSGREAEVDSKRVDTEIKLLNAKRDYELTCADIRRRDLEAAGQSEKAKAEAETIRANARSLKALARIQEAAARAIERRNESVDDALDRLRKIVDRIRDEGGDVEITFSQRPQEER